MPPVSLSRYLYITRASALYDIVVVVPFATPWTFALIYPLLSQINIWMGGEALPPFERIHILTTCLMGSLVMLWSLMRLLEPSLQFGRYDGLGRFLFATWMVWALVEGGLPLVWLFLVPELVWGVAQYWPVASVPAAACRRKGGLTLVQAS